MNDEPAMRTNEANADSATAGSRSSPPAGWSAARSRSASPVRWAAVFGVALGLYVPTCARVIGWQDFGQFVQRVVEGELVNPLGLALAHPLHYWIARVALHALPVEPPFAVALVSALFGAVTVANVFVIVRQFTGRARPALLAAAGLMVAHTFWRMSTMAECYTLTTALLTAEVWFLLRWDQTRRPIWLVCVFLANGLGLANHNVAMLSLPVIGIVLLMAVRRHEVGWRTFGAAGLGWFLGASPYLALVAQQAGVTQDVAGTIDSALFGKGFRDEALAMGIPWRHTLPSLAFTLLSFPNVMLPAALLGAVRRGRARLPPLTRNAVVIVLCIHLLYVLRYNVTDQYTFLPPAFSLIAILAGAGFGVVRNGWAQKPANTRSRRVAVAMVAGSIAMTPLLYLAAAPVARRFQVLGVYARNKPFRDDYTYLFAPGGRGDDSAARLSKAAVSLAQPAGVIVVEDGMAAFAVRYELWRRRIADVKLIARAGPDGPLDSIAYPRRVVLVPRRSDLPPPPTASGAWRPEGELYVLEPGPLQPVSAPLGFSHP